MKILHISTYDTGGAANACLRLHRGLMQIKGVQSNVLVRYKKQNEKNTYCAESPTQKKLSRITRRMGYKLGLFPDPTKSKQEFDKEELLKLYFCDSEIFTFPDSNIDITQHKLLQEADIVHLHWVANFLDYDSFFRKNKKPIVWTLHDMAPFRGGLHYDKLITGIDQDGYPSYRDLSKQEEVITEDLLAHKLNALKGVKNMTIVAPSTWLKNESQKSALLGSYPHCVIRNGIDTSIFKVSDQSFARKVFNLPLGKTILLFVADSISNYRKGFALLLKAMEHIKNDNVIVCTVGSSANKSNSLQLLELGRIDDERLMAVAYASADAFIIPSIEDNLPNTMLESLACGTPVIGFPIGGIAEIVDNDKNGELAEEVSVTALKNAILKFLDYKLPVNNNAISKDAHEAFSLINQAGLYQKLYLEILNKPN